MISAPPDHEDDVDAQDDLDDYDARPPRRSRGTQGLAAAIAALVIIGLLATAGLIIKDDSGSGLLGQDDDAVAAVVDGQSITYGDLREDVEAIAQSEKLLKAFSQSMGIPAEVLAPDGVPTASLTAQVLTETVYFTLLQAEMDARGWDATDEDRAQVQEQVDSLELSDEASKPYFDRLVERQADLTAFDRLSEQAAYDDDPSQWTGVCARHILFGVTDEQGNLSPVTQTVRTVEEGRELAESARARIVAGEDFGAVADELSDDGSPGGDLGCFQGDGDDQLDPVFVNGMRGLKVNELSEPVRTQYGWHIIEVTSRGQLSAAQAEPLIRQQQSGSAAFLTEKLASAVIEVDPRIGEWTADPTTGGGVVPADKAELAAKAATVQSGDAGDPLQGSDTGAPASGG